MRIAVDARILELPRPTGVERSFVELLRAADGALAGGTLDAAAPIGDTAVAGGALDDDVGEMVVLGRSEPRLPAGCGPRVRAVGLGGPRTVALWRETHLAPALSRLGADVLWSPVAAIPLATRVPRVATVHEVPWIVRPGMEGRMREAVHRVRVRIAARRATRIVCPSVAAAAQLEQAHPGVSPSVRVVPHAVAERFRAAVDPVAAADLRKRAGLSAGPFFLHVGGARARKNLPLLVGAFGAYRRTGGRVPLVLAGPGKPAFEVPETVRALGYVDDDLLLALYDGALALLVSSESEGFGIPVLEAMSRGVPVAAAAAGGVPEAAGGAAFLLRPGDERGLASAMRRLDRDRVFREELSRRGRARAQSARWDVSARALVDVLRDAAGPR